MPPLPTDFLKAVVRIEGEAGPMVIWGTGFIYLSAQRTNLVTCKHVVEDIRNKLQAVPKVVFNVEGSGERLSFHAPYEDWTYHPSDDIAVVGINGQLLHDSGIQFKGFSSAKNTYTRATAEEAGQIEGASVLIIGFPEGWLPSTNDYPVVRSGIIAQARGWLNGDHDRFLVDGSGFGGNSGGPVISCPEIYSLYAKFGEFRLLGMMKQTAGKRIELQTGEQVEQFKDLIHVVPVDAIEETIELSEARHADNAQLPEISE